MIQLVEEAKDPENNIFIYDVRSTSEIRSTGKICDHAIQMSDPTGFSNPSFDKPPLDATVVFSCHAGNRSRYASSVASEQGYEKVMNYSGGAVDWFR